MAANNTLITVDLSDDPKLRYGTTIIKRRALVQQWGTESDREIRMKLLIRLYANNAGAYGVEAIAGIDADATITADQKARQREIFKDQEINYTTRGRWVLANGTPVAEGTANAITELEYWQTFTLDQVQAITDMNFGAFAAVYAIATAMIQRLDSLKILG